VPFAPFPCMPFSCGDSVWHATEDAYLQKNPRNVLPNDGFGDENSVFRVLWDLQEMFGLPVSWMWDHIKVCCDRADQLWTSIVRTFGITNPNSFAAAEAFVRAKMAPEAIGPRGTVSASTPPTFSWEKNGDRYRRNNSFFLVVSRDDFQTYSTLQIEGDLSQYTPTNQEWQLLIGAGPDGTEFKWLVVGRRSDAPQVPEGWYWYSNLLSFRMGAIELAGQLPDIYFVTGDWSGTSVHTTTSTSPDGHTTTTVTSGPYGGGIVTIDFLGLSDPGQNGIVLCKRDGGWVPRELSHEAAYVDARNTYSEHERFTLTANGDFHLTQSYTWMRSYTRDESITLRTTSESWRRNTWGNLTTRLGEARVSFDSTTVEEYSPGTVRTGIDDDDASRSGPISFHLWPSFNFEAIPDECQS
jgi:hypothetical protein